IVIYGGKQFGIISFNVNGIHAHDVSEYLSSKGISIRAGHMCCQPLMFHLGLSFVSRVSFHVYNVKEDIDFFIKELKNCISFFKRGEF
ncbi:MAG: aminotransferase class V-fold PLP-dependent enzyme, partial [Nanoarchaeota archaeon]